MADPARKPASIRERLDELYRRLRVLPRPASADEALRQLCETLNGVENELSGIVRQQSSPQPPAFDGRMYCPLEDFLLRHDDGSIVALTRGHRIEISSDGSLRILNKLTGEAEFST
jgi:hypothetical protein